MRESLLKFLFLILFFRASLALADVTSEGWSWGVGCDSEGTFGNSTFTATANDSGSFSGSGTCARTSTNFTQFVFTSTSGGTLASSTLYALHTGDVLIVPPTLSSDVEPIFMTAPYCPIANHTLNWIFVQWDSTTNPLTNTYLLGTATYNTTSGITVTSQYDVSGAMYFSTSIAMSGSCSGGIYASSSIDSSELDGNVYFTATGAGVYKTNPGHATMFFPQYLVTPSTDLANQSAPGITFDSTTATHTREVLVTTDSTGEVYTIQPYLNPSTATIDSSYTDTITITGANTPQNGMLIGTVTRTGTGAGTAKVACIVNMDFDFRVVCTGQTPANTHQYPYNTTFVIQRNCPANYVRVPKNPAVGTYTDFCVAKYEMGADIHYNATSSQTAIPWNSVTRPTAISLCQGIGTGYDMITNAEWQTVAREIETAYSTASDIYGNTGYLNWSGGCNPAFSSCSGQPYLNMGNNGQNGPTYAQPGSYQGLAADVDTNPCSGMTAYPNCANNTSSDWAFKRTFELSNGNIIWDFAGNNWTWVKDDISTTQGANGLAQSAPWNSGTQSTWGPAGNYSSLNSGNHGGLGYQFLDYNAGGIIRGGYWGEGAEYGVGAAGVFNAHLDMSPSFSQNILGFRCTWHP